MPLTMRQWLEKRRDFALEHKERYQEMGFLNLVEYYGGMYDLACQALECFGKDKRAKPAKRRG